MDIRNSVKSNHIMNLDYKMRYAILCKCRSNPRCMHLWTDFKLLLPLIPGPEYEKEERVKEKRKRIEKKWWRVVRGYITKEDDDQETGHK